MLCDYFVQINKYQLVFVTSTRIAQIPTSMKGRTHVRLYETKHPFLSKHDTLKQCCFNAGPASSTLAQH